MTHRILNAAGSLPEGPTQAGALAAKTDRIQEAMALCLEDLGVMLRLVRRFRASQKKGDEIRG